MAVRITLGLAALLCLVGMAVASWPVRPHQTEPSKLEKACWVKRIYVPCFLLDEYGPTEFRI